MIVNILRFSFREDTTEEQRARTLDLMRRTASVESVAFGSVGQDLGNPADGYTHAFLAAVEDVDALNRYFYDPVHLAGDHTILPTIGRMTAVRLSDDLDPDLRTAIGAAYQEKVTAYPDFAALMDGIPELRL